MKFTEIPKTEWPTVSPDYLTRAWVNTDFLVQYFEEPNKPFRLSVNRTKRLPNGRWKDGITWDELMDIQRALGLSSVCAIEIFPPDEDIVNVANMRHLWIIDKPDFMWIRD